MRILRLCATCALLLACAACGSSATTSSPTSPPPSRFHGFVLHPPVPAPAFALRDQSGRALGPASQRGHWFVVAFLYTHCPDVCPLIADNLAAAQRKLPGLGVLAVSVDPKGDTPAAVRSFLSAHGTSSRFHYLTGSRQRLHPVWTAYHVASTDGPNGVVGHSSFELLVDPSGRERLLYDSKLTAAAIKADIARLARG